MKILTWNINLASSLGWNNKKDLKKNAVNIIFEINADIIVLTEFTVLKGWDYLQEKMENNGYIWLVTNIPGDNGILICVKKELIAVKSFTDNLYNNNLGVVQLSNKGCNLLKVTLPLKAGKDLTIIGFRMKTGRLGGQAFYDFERETFANELLPHIASLRNNCIVCGDFNNARCLGNLNEVYDEKNYAKMVQCNYNLNIIKDYFSLFGFQMLDLGNGYSYNTWPCNSPNGPYVPNDHIFVRFNNKIKVNKVETVKTEYSDHCLLWTEIISDD